MAGAEAHAASVAAVTMGAAVLMTRVALREGRLRFRAEHRCVSCGTIVHTRVCPRCNPVGGDEADGSDD
jgi:hypothetical protein